MKFHTDCIRTGHTFSFRDDWGGVSKAAVATSRTAGLWYSRYPGWVECERPYTADDLKLREDTTTVTLSAHGLGQYYTVFYSKEPQANERAVKSEP